MQAILDLEATSKKTNKLDILFREKDNKTLQTFFRLCLNPYIVFYIRGVRETTKSIPSTLDEVMEFLENVIAARKITGHEAMEEVAARMVSLNETEKSMVFRILKKAPDCGVSEKTVNKVWNNLIPIFPVLLAEPFTEKLSKKLNWKKGVIVQTKNDGARSCIIVDHSGNVTVRSRAGNLIETHQNFDFLSEYAGLVFDGELVTINPETKKFDVRQVGNGIVNKAVRGTISPEEASRLHVVMWDCIPYDDFIAGKSDLPYENRFEHLRDIIDSNEKVSIIWAKLVHSLDEARVILGEHISRGEEGIMLKEGSMTWEDGRSKQQLKMKLEVENDFEVVGWNPGEGALQGNMGSLKCSSSDRKVNVDVSGFSLELRSQICANLTGNPVVYTITKDDVTTTHTALPNFCDINLGTIINVMHGGCLVNKQGEYSVFLPRFKRECPDKTTADTFEQISANMIG